VWTSEGVHPYDEVAWERRDIVMTNWRDGSVNFEQRGVEFPDFWSVNAANIVTTKYFRGAVGTPQREWSLRQLIDRVVKTYRAAGEQNGYFATPADAEVFEHELTWMLLHQVFSFNSPVWFNVGTASPQQVSACFILAVDDSMDSILEWYKEEGLIFKGGSGSGVNLSRIRSSKELLSSGGTASGPVSFMRGADASAGTIKSGGATRRAAKMVILDVDHPDVEEFIETKAREENKIRALRDAGFDMDLGGSDIVSVQYQNANNSVRVSEEFMRAVETGGEFALRGRLDGSVIDTLDARSLWRRIARAAWECADPGVQYDDTINDWHTCPETGRITASNPCSEYMHLDNSSCNLASLNLMKFLGTDGAFAVQRFVRSVELVITAMDISICFADFPTEKIGATTRAYRQLGIGYANLGALLMASGLAYDSVGGRSLAAAITSVMTGTAYRRSAELAGVVGTYDGYARNATAHTRVMRKHAAANAAVVPAGDVDSALLSESTRQWQRCLEIGERNGWRNAQASVLAPTGTIGLMMDCDTTGVEPDLALVKFKKLVGGGSMQIVNQTVPRALRNLGYQEEQVEAIIEYIAEHGHVVDAPGLKPHHYSVFDCAMGERAIAPMGHVRMMAAIQPFISGAISKTVNMPESATVEEVENIYFEGWKLGLKALAIYRDNCKVGQPLSNAKPATEPDSVVLGGRRRGLPHRVVVPGRRARRGVPQDVQAGLDAGRRDGRVLRGDLDRPAVRGAAGDLRQQVHEHAVRAGRHDRRPGHPHVHVGDGLHLPSAGAGLPALRHPGRAGHLHRRRAGRPGARGERRGRRRHGRHGRLRAGREPGREPGRGAEAGRGADAGRGHERGAARRGSAGSAAGRFVHRTARGRAGQGCRRAAVLHLRHQDAPGGKLLRLRGLRLDQRLQLTHTRIVDSCGRHRTPPESHVRRALLAPRRRPHPARSWIPVVLLGATGIQDLRMTPGWQE
jgi:ribonucleoside-diphosphate reductase alpha chain